MNDKVSKPRSRRKLFCDALRGALVAFIAGSGISAIEKRRRLVARGVCINKSMCCNCKGFDICSLPAARSAKKAKGIS
jgi:hypothetical protein